MAGAIFLMNNPQACNDTNKFVNTTNLASSYFVVFAITHLKVNCIAFSHNNYYIYEHSNMTSFKPMEFS